MAAYFRSVTKALEITGGEKANFKNYTDYSGGRTWPTTNQVQYLETKAGRISLVKGCPSWAIMPDDVKRLRQAGIDIKDGKQY